MTNEQKEQQSNQSTKTPNQSKKDESKKDEISQEELSAVTGGFRPKHDGETEKY